MGAGPGGPARADRARRHPAAGRRHRRLRLRHGEVWAVHIAWSGDHVTSAERRPTARSAAPRPRRRRTARPGEIRLEPGESYTSPWVFVAWSGAGLDGRATCCHRLAARPPRAPPARPAGHPQHLGGRLLRPRPGPAAPRSPTGPPRSASNGSSSTTAGSGRGATTRRGLGDWYVDADVWPDGLAPARSTTCAGSAWSSGSGSSPRWSTPTPTCSARTRTGCSPATAPVGDPAGCRPGRHQQVLDLAHPGVRAYLLGAARGG